jgi:hypothetical protein
MSPQQAIRQPEIRTNRIRDLLQGSYSRNTEARELGEKNKMRLDESLSNAEQKLFVDEKGNPTIAYAGSRKISDWLVTNPLLALGLEKYSTRFRDSKKLMDNVRNKYKKPSTILGHSLSGAITEYVGNKNDKLITVDKGVGFGDIGKTIPKNQTDIRASNDIVSLLNNTQHNKGKKITIKDKSNFNILKAHDYRKLEKLNNKII